MIKNSAARRALRILSLLTIAMATVVIGACTGSEPTATQGSNPDGTRTVQHAMGTTEVPAEPERVVVMDMGEMDMALALGVQPIGAALYTADQEFADYLQDDIDNYTRIGTVGEPDLELIASLNPDLIISNKTRHEDIYDELSEIAPTVFAEALGADWKPQFEVVAKALGKVDRHAEIMNEYRDRLAQFRESMGDRLDETHVSIVRSFPDHIRLYMKASFIGTIIEDSGLPRPEPQDKDIFMERISAERIRDLQADVIFTLYYNPSAGEQLSSLIENPLWDQLEAVQAGQVYEMSDAVWGTGLGPLAAMEVISDLERVLVEGNVDSTVWAGPGGHSTFPATVEHKYGETTINEKPQRVLSLGYQEQDTLLALGVKPIAVRYWFGDESNAVFPWAQDELGDADPEVLNMPFGELDYEKIASLNPDLISAVYSGITQEEYETLSQIAPVVAQSGDFIDFGMPWQESTLLIGKALGKEAEAQRKVDALESRMEQVRQDHPDWQDASVAVVAPRSDGQIGIFASGDLRSRFFSSLGFEVPESFDEAAGDSFYANVSMEQVEMVDTDLLIFHQLSYLEGGREVVESDPLWSGLDALQEGRAIYLGFETDSAFSFNSLLSMDYFLDVIAPRIEAAMDGDPSTEANP